MRLDFSKTVETIIQSSIFWGIVALIVAAVALSGKFSLKGADTVLVIAWIIAVVGVFRGNPVSEFNVIPKVLTTMLVGSVLGLCFYALSGWYHKKEGPAAMARDSKPVPEKPAPPTNEQKHEPPADTQAALPAPRPQQHRAPSRLAVINVQQAIFNRDDQAHTLRIAIVLQNFGDWPTKVHFTYTILLNSVPATGLNSLIPDTMAFAPKQPNSLNVPLGMTPENYASFLSGQLLLDVKVTAEYDESPGVKKTFVYIGRVDPKTNMINTLQNELQ